jgi:hypothetical protein
MEINKAYSDTTKLRRMLSDFSNVTIIALLLFCLPVSSVFSQDLPEYDEISIFINVPLVGGGDIAAVIKGQELYLPVTDLFDFLKIRNVPSPGLETISGFFINPDAKYLISRTDNQIRYQDKTFILEPGDLIRTESNLYLRASYFGKVFGLDCIFNFRSLSVTVNSKLELPLIREMRQEEMRKNITHLKGEIKADTTIGRTYPLFKFGMADWSAIATEEVNGNSETSLNLALGAMIAGGEANASLYYNSNAPFLEKQQYYLWRYVNNDFTPLRQVMIGKIPTNAISSIYNPVVGIELTNTPTTYRRSFGSYTLSDKTEPGWIVELYVNNVLVDYVKADASGFFTFEVPLVYGNSIVRLKFYGPWGEERTREQNITIPFNFLPKNTIEYTVSAGIVEDSIGSRYSRASINYGVTRSLTLGGGIEYLSSLLSAPAMPYLNASLRITNNILLSGEYTYGVRAKGTLTYRFPANVQLDVNYTWYDKDQKAINYNYREERKAVLSMPLKIGKFFTYQRFSVNQIVLPLAKYTSGEWLFSGSLMGISTNLTTSALFFENTSPYIYSNLSLAMRLPSSFVVMPQAQYSYSQKEFISAKVLVEKHISEHAFLNLSYEQLFSSNTKMAELGFRYDFSFAQTGASVRQTNNRTTLVQYARGSLVNDSKTKYLGTDNRTNVGKGGITIIPFLDLNSNGRKDPGEPKAYGLNLRANGGRVEKSERDSTIRILGLEPYTTCYIELDPNSFDNISWRLQKPTLNVEVDPNILKLIEIPISVVGEATGSVKIVKAGETRGLGRIIVSFFYANMRPAGKTLSEDDGYFSYFGLTPGRYSVMIDTGQLNKLNMISEPETLSFEVKAGTEGEIINGLDFIVRERPDTSRVKAPVPEEPTVRKDTTRMIIHELTQELVTITEDSYAIQLGAFKSRSNAEAMRRKLQRQLNEKLDIVIEGDFYKVRINDLKDRKEVDENISVLKNNGITELWVISLKAKKQQWIINERQDTVNTITERIMPAPVHDITIQLGAFRDQSNAIALLKHLKVRYGDRLKMVFDGGFYKIRLTGSPLLEQTVLDEMNKEALSLGKLKFKDIWVVPPELLVENEPEVRQPETPVSPVEWNRKVPAVLMPKTSGGLTENKIVGPSMPSEPAISLQVGVFHRKADALRAQRRIISKLNLPVEIVQQWDYYHVLITGFYTREETYKYYPELAGMGYPSIMLIEKKK